MVAVVVLPDNCHRKVITEGTADIFHFGGLADSDGGWGRQYMLGGHMSCTSSEMQSTTRGVVLSLVMKCGTGGLRKIFISKTDFEGAFQQLFAEMGFEYTLEAADLSDPNIECFAPEQHTA